MDHAPVVRILEGFDDLFEIASDSSNGIGPSAHSDYTRSLSNRKILLYMELSIALGSSLCLVWSEKGEVFHRDARAPRGPMPDKSNSKRPKTPHRNVSQRPALGAIPPSDFWKDRQAEFEKYLQ